MITSKWIDRICIVAVIAALVLTTVVTCGRAAMAGSSEKTGTTMGYESRLFDTSKVHTIDIVMDEDDWDDLIENATAEEYVACAVVIDGESYRNVAIRAKGNTSLSQVSAMDSERYSFKIEFDHYVEGKTYHGLDKLCLNNLIQDSTYMKDYLTYTMMNQFGVDAPLCSYVYITVNGEDWGLYLAVEGVEDGFLERNYNSTGNLYKPDSMSFGAGPGNGADFHMSDFMQQFQDSSEDDSENNEGQAKQSGQDTENAQTSQNGEADQDDQTSRSSMPEGMPTPPDGSQTPEGMPTPPDGTQTQDGMRTPPDNSQLPGNFGGPGNFNNDNSDVNDTDDTGSNSANDSDSTENSNDNTSDDLSNTENASIDTTENSDDADAEDSGDTSGDPGSFTPPGNMPGNGNGGPGGFGGFGGGMGSDDVKLIYSDDDPDSYSNIFDNAKTDIDEDDEDRLIASLKALNEEEDLEDVVDIDEVIRYFVVHNYVCNGDSYTGAMIHNYYLYEKNGKLSMIPWDYNLAFGTFQAADDATSTVNSPIDTPVSNGTTDDRPMWDWIYDNAEYLEQYHEYFSEFLETVEIQQIIEDTYNLIAPYVEKDPTAFYTYDEFESGVKTLKEFCALRTESIEGQLDGTIPSTTTGQAEDDTNLVDASDLNLSDMGTQNQGNQGGQDNAGSPGDAGGPGSAGEHEGAGGFDGTEEYSSAGDSGSTEESGSTGGSGREESGSTDGKGKGSDSDTGAFPESGNKGKLRSQGDSGKANTENSTDDANDVNAEDSADDTQAADTAP